MTKTRIYFMSPENTKITPGTQMNQKQHSLPIRKMDRKEEKKG